MIGIIDYGMGNLSSVKNLLDFLNIESEIIQVPEHVQNMDRIIIPGVGAFQMAMNNLHEKQFVQPIQTFAKSGKPVLGICLGMQLLAEVGTEPEECKGLGLVPGKVELLKTTKYRIPHIGWNGVKVLKEHPILEDVKLSADFYFVHSYYFQESFSENVIATTEYDQDFSSIVANKDGNVIGIQFHPEKSQKQGIKIIENFSKFELC